MSMSGDPCGVMEAYKCAEEIILSERLRVRQLPQVDLQRAATVREWSFATSSSDRLLRARLFLQCRNGEQRPTDDQQCPADGGDHPPFGFTGEREEVQAS